MKYEGRVKLELIKDGEVVYKAESQIRSNLKGVHNEIRIKEEQK